MAGEPAPLALPGGGAGGGAGATLRRLLNFFGHGGPPPAAQAKGGRPVRIGVLGASQVATYALLWPSRRLPAVVVAAVAARDGERASAYARQHGIPAWYGSYQELLDDPTLDAIYVATPNGMHGDWAAAALRARKHVLCEKPFTANAEEARAVQAEAKKQGLLCREAFHYREHPANAAVAALLQGGAIGQLKELRTQVLIPAWAFSEDNIRFKFNLAGGTMMDAGTYCAHTLRFFSGCSRPRVVAAAASKLLDGGLVDGRMEARLAYPAGGALGAGAVGRLEADLRSSRLWPRTRFTAVGTEGSLELDNFIMPFLGHSITVVTRAAAPRATDAAGAPGRGGGGGGGGLAQRARRFSVYSGGAGGPDGPDGAGESNYYHQLSRFIGDLQVLQDAGAPRAAKRAVRSAMADDAADCQDNMALIDAVYKASGLPLRQPTHATVALGSAEAASLLPPGARRR